MPDRVLAALGDRRRAVAALARTYITLDFRRPAAERQGRDGRSGGSPLSGLLFISGIGSLVFASVARVPDR